MVKVLLGKALVPALTEVVPLHQQQSYIEKPESFHTTGEVAMIYGFFAGVKARAVFR